jgi:hypothetical protein
MTKYSVEKSFSGKKNLILSRLQKFKNFLGRLRKGEEPNMGK